MHIVVGFLVALGSILWALNRLQANGVNLNAFNPFTWFRRHKWQQQYGKKALHDLKSPMEVATIFLVGIALLEGELTKEQKDYILSIFIDEFGLSKTKALELYASASYLIKDEIDLSGQVRHIVEPVKSSFTEEQIDSLLLYLNKVAIFDGDISDMQRSLISSVEREFALMDKLNAKWS